MFYSQVRKCMESISGAVCERWESENQKRLGASTDLDHTENILFFTFIGIVQPPKDDIKFYATLGTSFIMPCVFSSWLVPIRPLVEKLDSRIPHVFSNRSVSSSNWDKSIIIQEVVPENEGKYRCGGTINGTRLTRTMQLVVAKSKFLKQIQQLFFFTAISINFNVLNWSFLSCQVKEKRVHYVELPPVGLKRSHRVQLGQRELWHQWD